ncbi:hypothetical protein [Flavobacterium sp.]|uniref:hypothetical protein n=3 Tax=Flavobacterium sp. TaxID=239 RepID=UPI0040473FAA
MRQEFLNIVNQLKNNPYYAISIIDDSTMNKVLSRTLGSTLIQNHGSVENYFEHLKNSGVSSFTVQEYKKNGSGFKNTGKVIKNLTFHDKNTAVNPVQSNIPANSSLNGLAGQVVALGFTEAVNFMADSKDKVRLEEENKFLKSKNEDLTKQLEELKEERLANKYDTASKSSQNELIMGLVNNLPALASVFTKQPSASLGNPVQQNLSKIKIDMINWVQNQNVSDSLLEVLIDVATKISTEQGFSDKLEDILNPQL